MAAPTFQMVLGADDFFVSQEAARRWELLRAEAPDAFSQEIVVGMANTVDEVATIVERAIQAIETLPLLGGKKVVWIKDINFMADSVVGRSENTLEQVRRLQEVLLRVDPAAVGVLLSASPVDRRRREAKWFEKEGDTVVLGGDDSSETLLRCLQQEVRSLGVRVEEGTLETLVERVKGHSRLAVAELHKLATYAGPDGPPISPALVLDLVPPFGDTNFFEVADSFFSLDVAATLAAVRRHFFAGHDARPLLVSLQNRNRLLIQLRVLKDAGVLRFDSRGLPRGALEEAGRKFGHLFGGATEKSNLNVFSQNAFYISRLSGSAARVTLKRLIDFQLEFLHAFEALLERPNEAEAVIRDLVLRCLGNTRA